MQSEGGVYKNSVWSCMLCGKAKANQHNTWHLEKEVKETTVY